MSNKITVTETLNEKGYCVRVTQRYSVDYDRGHWLSYITQDGHIVAIRESGPALPQGTVSQETCKELLNLYLRSLEL